jgi:hypothetical protein
MSSNFLKSVAFLAMTLAGSAAMAQTDGGASAGNGSLSGNLGGMNADFAAGTAAGSNTGKNGGLISSIDKAMGGTGGERNRDTSAGCGKVKCD